MDLLHIHDIIILYIGHLENIDIPSYVDLLNIDAFHFVTFKKIC